MACFAGSKDRDPTQTGLITMYLLNVLKRGARFSFRYSLIKNTNNLFDKYLLSTCCVLATC